MNAITRQHTMWRPVPQAGLQDVTLSSVVKRENGSMALYSLRTVSIERTALLDTVDLPLAEPWLAQIAQVPKIDYIVSHHLVVLPYVSMHGSTQQMVDHLIAALADPDVRVEPFNLVVTVIGKLAISLVDAATIVVGTPTVLAGPHPLAAYGTFLANALRPKALFLSIIGSYGWGGKTVETLAGMIPNLKVEAVAQSNINGLFMGATPKKEKRKPDRLQSISPAVLFVSRQTLQKS